MSDFFTEFQTRLITDLALEAGEIMVRAFRTKDFSLQKKADGSEVTSADIAVSKFLYERLQLHFPEIPIVCEEGESHDVLGDIFFLIDPIDGTSSFVKGNTDFSLNIAVIQNRKPVFGLIYAPLFEGGKMAFSGQCPVPSVKFKDCLRIITSTRSKDHDIQSFVSRIFPDFRDNFVVEKLSSAAKFFRLLEGDADLYLHFRPSMEWDIAAGQALVCEFGGKLKNFSREGLSFVLGEEMLYKKPAFENPPFCVISAHCPE
ncbi:MAG: hypothetical protein FJX34_00540 [Alphaproteobacteria bacterium]|nr:hypothetical protein [Alphaproteobacteria bacterium]